MKQGYLGRQVSREDVALSTQSGATTLRFVIETTNQQLPQRFEIRVREIERVRS